MNEANVSALVRTLGGQVAVNDPPVEAVLRRGHRRARGRRLAASAVVAACTLIAILAGFLVSNDGHPDPQPIGIEQENPLPVPWWADDTLHLAHRTVKAPGLTQLVQVGDAVAYATEKDVVLVLADGKRTTLSHQAYVGPLAGSGKQGWLAWVDPRHKAPQLVIYDVPQGRELGRLDLLYRGSRWGRLDAGPHPLSIEGDRVSYAGQDGDWSWAPGDDAPRRITPANVDVIDLRAGYRLQHTWTGSKYGWRDDLELLPPPNSDVGFTGPASVSFAGRDGRLSPSARYLGVTADGIRFYSVAYKAAIRLALPKRPDSDSGPAGFNTQYSFAGPSTVLVATGGRLRPRPTGNSMGIDFATYETWDLSTCSLRTGRCTTFKDFTQGRPVLPH